MTSTDSGYGTAETTPSPPLKVKSKKRFSHVFPYSDSVTQLLEAWYKDNEERPYLTASQTRRLASQTRLTSAQVRKWMANRRVRAGNTRPRQLALSLLSTTRETAVPSSTNKDTAYHQQSSTPGLPQMAAPVYNSPIPYQMSAPGYPQPASYNIHQMSSAAYQPQTVPLADLMLERYLLAARVQGHSRSQPRSRGRQQKRQ